MPRMRMIRNLSASILYVIKSEMKSQSERMIKTSEPVYAFVMVLSLMLKNMITIIPMRIRLVPIFIFRLVKLNRKAIPTIMRRIPMRVLLQLSASKEKFLFLTDGSPSYLTGRLNKRILNFFPFVPFYFYRIVYFLILYCILMVQSILCICYSVFFFLSFIVLFF